MKAKSSFMNIKIQASACMGMLLISFAGTNVAAQGYYENQNKRLKSMPQMENGNVGGGGTTIANQLADAKRIELVINQTQWLTHYLLNDLFRFYFIEKKQKGIEAWLKQEHNTWLAWQALFEDENGKENLTVLGEMKTANIEIRRDRPCSYKSEHRLASADRASKTICFSISEILEKKHVNAEIEKKIVALFMHELTHLMGLEDETSANNFQKFIENRYAKIDFIGTDILIQELMNGTTDRQDVLGQNLAEFLRVPNIENCWKIGFSASETFELLNSDELKGRSKLSITIFDPVERAFLTSAAMFLANASQACARFKDGEGIPFDKQISIYQLIVPAGDSDQPAYLPSESQIYKLIGITGTKFGDFDKAKSDLVRARELILAAERRLKQYPRMNTLNYSW